MDWGKWNAPSSIQHQKILRLITINRRKTFNLGTGF
jgi:hypothetical protein